MARWMLVLTLVLMVGERPEWAQTTAPKRLEFEVASVRENKSDEKSHSNFPLSPQSQYLPNGGRFSATNMSLFTYIVFAYVQSSYQVQALRAQLPEWVRGARYDIQAEAPGEPTKDEMRRMMQSLLEDRFQMKVHHEMRRVPVFALELVKPGKLGAGLRVHPADDPECTKEPLPVAIAGGYPATCGTGAQVPGSAVWMTGVAGHKMTIPGIAVGLTGSSSEMDRPVVDKTGLSGTYDFKLEWAREGYKINGSDPQGPGAETTFVEALKDQLGLKLVPGMGEVDVIVLNRIERPSEN
jgi:uncharacterized protein (TIGR03435 family)